MPIVRKIATDRQTDRQTDRTKSAFVCPFYIYDD